MGWSRLRCCHWQVLHKQMHEEGTAESTEAWCQAKAGAMKGHSCAPDVVRDALVEEHCVLGDHRDGAPHGTLHDVGGSKGPAEVRIAAGCQRQGGSQHGARAWDQPAPSPCRMQLSVPTCSHCARSARSISRNFWQSNSRPTHQCGCLDVLPINEHSPRPGVVEAQQQLEDGGLA